MKITALNNGKPRFPAVEKLVRQKKRIYSLKGNCAKYKELKKQVKEKLKIEGGKFIEKQVELAKVKGGGWQRKVKQMTARPGDDLTSPQVLYCQTTRSLGSPLRNQLRESMLSSVL